MQHPHLPDPSGSTAPLHVSCGLPTTQTPHGNCFYGGAYRGPLGADIARDGLVFVRSSNAREDLAALEAVEPEMLRRGLLPTALSIDALHGDIFDTARRCGDPFEELRASALTGKRASDLCLASTVYFYGQLHSDLPSGVVLLPDSHEVDLLAFIAMQCHGEGGLPAGARPLSVLAQHTLFALVEQAKRTSTDTRGLIPALRRLIAHGRLNAMLDPRDYSAAR